MMGRLSSRMSLGQGLSRLSLGISDALIRLGLGGAVPTSQPPQTASAKAAREAEPASSQHVADEVDGERVNAVGSGRRSSAGPTPVMPRNEVLHRMSLMPAGAVSVQAKSLMIAKLSPEVRGSPPSDGF